MFSKCNIVNEISLGVKYKNIVFSLYCRFGIIPCEKTTRFVKAGEELTLDYEYDLNNCPAWFKTAFHSYVEDKDNADKIQNLSPKYLSYMQNS